MQTPQNSPQTKPIAKRVKRQTTNLSKPADQLKIYRACYESHLNFDLGFSRNLTVKLLNIFDQFYNRENIADIFSLNAAIFHKAFILKLKSL